MGKASKPKLFYLTKFNFHGDQIEATYAYTSKPFASIDDIKKDLCKITGIDRKDCSLDKDGGFPGVYYFIDKNIEETYYMFEDVEIVKKYHGELVGYVSAG